MAEETQEAEEAPASGGGGKKLIIIIVLVLIVLGGGGAGAFFAMSGGDASDEELDDEDFEEEVEDDLIPSAVLPLDTFVVNLQIKGNFLKVEMQLEFATPELPPTIENDVPKIRDSVIRLLSGKSAADILSAEGKENLRDELRDVINETLGADDIVDVYFTEFIVQ